MFCLAAVFIYALYCMYLLPVNTSKRSYTSDSNVVLNSYYYYVMRREGKHLEKRKAVTKNYQEEDGDRRQDDDTCGRDMKIVGLKRNGVINRATRRRKVNSHTSAERER